MQALGLLKAFSFMPLSRRDPATTAGPRQHGSPPPTLLCPTAPLCTSTKELRWLSAMFPSLISLRTHISAEEEAAGSPWLFPSFSGPAAGRAGAQGRGQAEGRAEPGGRAVPEQRSHKGIVFLKSSCLTFLKTALSQLHFHFLMLPFQTQALI